MIAPMSLACISAARLGQAGEPLRAADRRRDRDRRRRRPAIPATAARATPVSGTAARRPLATEQLAAIEVHSDPPHLIESDGHLLHGGAAMRQHARPCHFNCLTTAAASAAPGRSETVVLLAGLMALNAFAIDAMIPALPAIGAALGVATDNRRQLVVARLFPRLRRRRRSSGGRSPTGSGASRSCDRRRALYRLRAAVRPRRELRRC